MEILQLIVPILQAVGSLVQMVINSGVVGEIWQLVQDGRVTLTF